MIRSYALLLGFVACTLVPGLSAAGIIVDASACGRVYDLLLMMKSGAGKPAVGAEVDTMLDSVPYRIMFRHYNRNWRPNHLSPGVFKRMIMSLAFPGEYATGENQRADRMLPLWRKFYADLPLFEGNLREIREADLARMITERVAFAQTWLPPEWRIPDIRMFIIPNGGSTAFTVEGVEGYDFFQLPRDSAGTIGWDELGTTVAHESHHLGVQGGVPGVMSRSDSTAYVFLAMFVGEGTATKFINDYPGGCVPAVDSSRKDPSFDRKEISALWRTYTSGERDLFARLVGTFEAARAGRLTPAAMNAETGGFWLSGYVSPVYFVGAELYGAVYLGVGKEGAFAAMRDPRMLFALYNRAVAARRDILGGCFVIPDSSVRHALAIGAPGR